MSEAPFNTFPYKIRRTVYMRNKKLARLKLGLFDSRQGQSTRSRRDNPAECARALLLGKG